MYTSKFGKVLIQQGASQADCRHDVVCSACPGSLILLFLCLTSIVILRGILGIMKIGFSAKILQSFYKYSEAFRCIIFDVHMRSDSSGTANLFQFWQMFFKLIFWTHDIIWRPVFSLLA